MEEYLKKRLKSLKKIHIIHYPHQDFAWTNTRQWHIKRYVENLVRTLDLLNEGKKFILMLDNILYGIEAFERYTPDRVDELRQRVEEGKIIVVNAGLSLVRPNNCGDELYIRNIVRGRQKLQKKFGDKGNTRIFLNADTAFGNGQLPQILRKSGHELYRFFRPLGALDYKKIPREFIYEGIDGSKIHISRGDYTSNSGATFHKTNFNSFEELKEAFVEQEVERHLPLQVSTDLVLFIGGDDVLPLMNTRDEYYGIPEIVEEWNKTDDVELNYSTLEKYLDEVKSQQLTTISDVLEPCDVIYNLPTRGSKSLWYSRFLADRGLVRLERLGVMLESLGGKCDFDKILSFWDMLIDFSGHGLEFLLEDDYEEVWAKAKLTNTLIQQYKIEISDLISQKIGLGTKDEYVVINTNYFNTKAPFIINVTTANNLNGFNIVGANGEIIPYQITNYNLGDKGFLNTEYTELEVVCDVTLLPFSINVYKIVPADISLKSKALIEMPYYDKHKNKNDSDAISIDNGTLKIDIDNGIIKSVVRKSDGVSIFCYDGVDIFGAIKLYHTSMHHDWMSNYDDIAVDTITVDRCYYETRGPLTYKYVIEGKIGNTPIRQSIFTYKNAMTIDFKTEICLDMDGFEGYMNVAFPCDKQNEIYAGIPFGAEKRDLENEVYIRNLNNSEHPCSPEETYHIDLERNVNEAYFAKHFTSFYANKIPVAILQGSCGIYYRRKSEEKVCELYLMRGVKSKQRKEPWVTLIGEDLNGMGYSSFEYSIAFPTTVVSFDELYKLAGERDYPVVVAPRYYTDCNNVVSNKQILELSNEELVLSTMYRENDAYYLRFFNPTNNSSMVKITANIPYTDAYICDLNGNETEKLRTDSGSIEITYHKYQIINIKLK